MLLSELPLTQLLLKGDVAWNGNYNRDADPQTEILTLGIMRNDTSIKEIFDKYLNGNVDVTVDSAYMFGKLSSVDFCISHPQGSTKTSKLKYQTKPRVQKILWKHTRWFPLLKLQVRNSLLNLITVDSNKCLNFCKFRRVLEAVDHICTGLFLSGERQSVINRVQVALISNMVVTGEKGYYTYLKGYKSLVKGLRKAVLSAAPIPEIQPCFHWIKGTAFWTRLNQVVSNPTTGWQELQHVLVVLQTRSTGLANDPWVKDSLVKWIKVTSNSESNYTSTFIQEGANLLDKRVKDSGIISLTAASCVESSRSQGGKFSKIQDIIDDIRLHGVHLVDWDTGELSPVVSKLPDNISISDDWGDGIEPYISQDLGYYLFSYALERFYESYDSSHINLSAVIEQGKARVVTPNSLILYLLTMPLSHATLRCFENIPELCVGVSKTNDAWEFWKRMRSSTLNDNGTYDQSFICADLETATDYSPFELVSTTLEIMKDLGLQAWYVDVTKKLLSNPRWYRFTKNSIHRTSRGALMADPGTKSVLSLSHYLIIKSIEHSLGIDLCFAIKGDDVVIQTSTSNVDKVMQMYRIRMSKSGFVLSEDDTFISNKYAFYCEGVFRNYHLTSESPTSWNSLVNTSDPSYCDIPTVKLAFPVFRDNYRIGETPEGKISLLSKRRSYFRDGSFAKLQYEILDLIQTITFRLDDYDLSFLFGAKWKGGLSKPITPMTKNLLPISDDEKRNLILDFSFIITKVFKEKLPRKLRMPRNVLAAFARRTNRFYLRQDNDDEKPGEYKMIDFKINLPELWSSHDELEWGLSLGPTLLTITGISTDKSIKSKIVTLHNLSGTDLNIERRITQESIDDDCIIDDFKRSVSVEDFEEFYKWYQRIRNEQYPYVNWSLHLEKDFPLYNAMKVNPQDYQDTNLEEGIRNVIRRKDDIKQNPEILDVLKDKGLTRKQLLALRLALQLHGKSNIPGQLDDQAYEDAIESTTDFDQMVVFKLARMYNKIAEIIRVTASTGISTNELRNHLRKVIPHNYIIWFSADRERFKILEEMNLKYLSDLNVDNNLRWLFKIYIARYVPVGSITPYGYMIEKYVRKDGYIPLVPEELTDDELYGDYFDDTVGFDFDNIESIAQSVREGTQREVNGVPLQGPRTELGYHIVEDVPGLLTS